MAYQIVTLNTLNIYNIYYDLHIYLKVGIERHKDRDRTANASIHFFAMISADPG